MPATVLTPPPATAGAVGFTVTFHGPFHVASGRASDGADRTVDPENLLPASSLKGLLRAAADTRLRIDRDLLARIFGDEPVRPDCSDRRFGPGAWAWSDAVISDPLIAPVARIKMSERGVVRDEALMIGQQAWCRYGTFRVTAMRALPDGELRAHVLTLRAAARDVTSLGGGRRRGEGWVSITDDAPWTDADSTELLALRAETPSAAVPAEAPAPDHHPAAAAAPVVTLTYRLVADQQICAGVGAEIGNSQQGHHVLPGSVVRGALATRWMVDQGLRSADQRMADLFDRDVLVGQAVPVGSQLESVSAMLPKYDRSPAGQVPARYDQAFDARSELLGAAAPDRSSTGLRNGRGWRLVTDQRTQTTRTALTPQGTAQTGALFTTAAVKADTVFVGTVVVPAADQELLDWLKTPKTVRVGGQRSIAGAASWRIVPRQTPAGGVPDGPAVIRCRSPLILLDAFGAATLDIGGALRGAFPESTVRLERGWVRSVRVGGWHMASGLPKAEEWAIAAGSTFLVSGLPSDAAAVLIRGLGIRRQEGHGQVEVLTDGEQSFGAPVTDPAPPDPPPGRQATTSPPPGAAPSTPKPPEPSAAVAGPDAAFALSDPFSELARIAPSDDLLAILKGLADTARRVVAIRAAGLNAVAAGVIKKADRLPWLRGQADPVRDLVVGLLSSDQVAGVADRARREIDSRRAR